MIEMLNMDCMEYMAGLDDNAFELAVVDPPYGINVNVSMGRRRGQKHSVHRKFAGEDKAPPSIEYFKQLKRVSANQVIWGANHFIDSIGFPVNATCWILWDKMFSDKVSFSQFEMAWTSLDGSCKKYDKNTNSNFKIHPTQKPIDLYRWIYTNYAKPGDRILDTHLGSASSAIAAHNMGFDFVGCELSEHYFDLSQTRYANETAQERMFI